MSNIVEIARTALDACSDDWRVSAAMLAGGAVMGAVGWWWSRRKERHERRG